MRLETGSHQSPSHHVPFPNISRQIESHCQKDPLLKLGNWIKLVNIESFQLFFFFFLRSPRIGKTLLAKAVANQTSATFLRVVGSELIQKYLGDGPKLVRELFRVAEEHAPSIVFIDEIDAIGTKR